MTGPAFALLASVFLLTQVVFGTVTGAFLMRVMAPANLPKWALVVLGIGLAPCLVTLMMYYLLWLTPGLSPLVVMAVVVIFFFAMGWYAREGWLGYRSVAHRLGTLTNDRSMWLYALCTVGFMVLTFVMLRTSILTEHDILEYGVQGGIFLRDMAIRYQPHHYDVRTGFYYVGLHGFTFPLLFTWEGLFSPDAASLSDPWVRSLTPFYAWLTVTLIWGLMRRADRWFAVWSILALGGAMGFFFLSTVYHLDALRIFLFTSSAALLVVVLRKPLPSVISLFAIVCAASAVVHSLGAILGALLFGIMIVMIPGTLKDRLVAALRFAFFFLAAGGIHYPMDVFLGTGWIFKDIIWY
jgi:hypothetical protein